MSPQLRRLRRAGIACALAAGTLLATGATAVASTPPTAKQQLDWLVAASDRLPIPTAVLIAVSSPACFETTIGKVASLCLTEVIGAGPTQVEALLTGRVDTIPIEVPSPE